MYADGFRRAFARYKIRTVINLQNEAPDPEVPLGFLTAATIRESELCRQHNVRYVLLRPDLVSRRLIPDARPKVIDEFLALMDDPSIYPVLIHCRAGLHRTGVLTAIYRMEYDGWSVSKAMRELKANGFGDREATHANDYIMQYVLSFQPGLRHSFQQSAISFQPE
jgi:protein tyrosine/serine phosphatase